MDIKSTLFYIELIVGLFLVIVISCFFIVALIFIVNFILKVIGLILNVIGRIAKILFKVLYVLLTIALIVSGAGCAVYTGLLFLKQEPISILWTLVGVFFMLLGVNGLVNFIKDGFRFSNEIASSSFGDFSSSSSYDSRTSSANDDYVSLEESNAAAEKFTKEFNEKRWADDDTWRAEQDQKDTLREEAYQAGQERDRANYEADQAKWAEFDRKREEDDEYNRRAREG
jgi:hypothetical protein